MSQPFFAALESAVAGTVSTVFGNVYLVKAGVPFMAVLDRNAERIGEFGQVVALLDQIVVLDSAVPALASGDVITPDPARYTPAELSAMRASWTLDGVVSRDGYLTRWWAR